MDKYQILNTIENAICNLNDPIISNNMDERINMDYDLLINGLIEWNKLLIEDKSLLRTNPDEIQMNHDRYIKWLIFNVYDFLNLLPGFKSEKMSDDVYIKKIKLNLKSTQVRLAILKETFNLSYVKLLNVVINSFILPSLPDLIKLLDMNRIIFRNLKFSQNQLIRGILHHNIYTLIT